VRRLRSVHDGAQRHVPQVHHLRHHHRLLVEPSATSPGPLSLAGERVLASAPSALRGAGRGEGLP
jgi:hypothetical protein